MVNSNDEVPLCVSASNSATFAVKNLNSKFYYLFPNQHQKVLSLFFGKIYCNIS